MAKKNKRNAPARKILLYQTKIMISAMRNVVMNITVMQASPGYPKIKIMLSRTSIKN